mgnify:CR=1 FL=1
MRCSLRSAVAHAPPLPHLRSGCDAHDGCECELEGLHAHVGSEIANVAVSVGGPMISAASCAPIRSSFFLSDFSSRRAVFGCGCVAQGGIAANSIQNLSLTQHHHSFVNKWRRLSCARSWSTGERVDGRGQSGERVDHSAKLTLSSSGVARAEHHANARNTQVPDFPISRFPDFPISRLEA